MDCRGVDLHLNTGKAFGRPFGEQDRRTVGVGAPEEARAFLSLWRKVEPTQFHRLDGLARKLGVAEIRVKDEGSRLGLGSFKALGGSHAVLRIAHGLAEAALGRALLPHELISSEEARARCATLTFTCATDGNHGKSVAAGASAIGARSKVFIHAGVSEPRARAIAEWGAEIVRVEGNYDDSVAEARGACEATGWHLVADGSWEGYEEAPGRVMQGYTVIADEILSELGHAAPPTHVFLQAGVGGFAAAISGHLRERLAERAPRAVVVEPERAACLFATAREGTLTRVPDAEPTVMAMLECYEASLVAWRILERAATAFLTVPEDAAPRAMRSLARPEGGDPPIVSGESGSAGLAGLLTVLDNPAWRSDLAIDGRSRILIVSTETATDPESYRRLVGVDPMALKTSNRES